MTAVLDTPWRSDRLRLSLVVCTWNRPSELAEVLTSIEGQTRVPDEVVVVDSSDVPIPRPRASLAGGTPIRWVSATPPGLTRQRNLGVSASSGDVILFVDDDSVLAPAYVGEVAHTFATPGNETVGAVLGRVVSGSSPGGPDLRPRLLHLAQRFFFLPHAGEGRLLPSGFQTLPHHLTDARDVEVLSGGAMSFRRGVFSSVAFDERLGAAGEMEDVDVARQLRRIARIRYVPSAVVFHRPSFRARDAEPLRLGRLADHHCYLHDKHGPHSIREWAAFWWSLGGLALLCGLTRRWGGGVRVLRVAARHLLGGATGRA